MGGKAPIILYAAPLVLSLIGMLCNSIGFVYNEYSLLNFLFSAAFCVVWIIIFTFAPTYRKKSLQIYLLGWWILAMLFAIGTIFSYFLTGGRSFDWMVVPDLMFVAPISGVQYATGTLDIGKYITASICFIFMSIALCQFFIAHNMWPEQDRQLEMEKLQEEQTDD